VALKSIAKVPNQKFTKRPKCVSFFFFFSTQLHPTYLWCGKMCRVRLFTELLYAIIPTLFLCFLLIWYPYIFVTFLMFFFSCKLWALHICRYYTYVGLIGQGWGSPTLAIECTMRTITAFQTVVLAHLYNAWSINFHLQMSCTKSHTFHKTFQT